LWSRVLHRAIPCEENPADVPWMGIFHSMVRALVGKRSEEPPPHISCWALGPEIVHDTNLSLSGFHCMVRLVSKTTCLHPTGWISKFFLRLAMREEIIQLDKLPSCILIMVLMPCRTTNQPTNKKGPDPQSSTAINTTHVELQCHSLWRLSVGETVSFNRWSEIVHFCCHSRRVLHHPMGVPGMPNFPFVPSPRVVKP
jgi:hypothetical protein